MLQHMLADGLLDQFYSESLRVKDVITLLAAMMDQLVHRYPNIDIIEISAGTNSATKSIFETVDLFN